MTRSPIFRAILGNQKNKLQEKKKAALAKMHFGRIDKATQILLSLRYQELARQKAALPTIEDTEFSGFSQNGEDGVLHYLFSVLGTTNKKAVEICAGDCIENNTTNLIVHHGWNALLCDGDEENIKTGKAFYGSRRDGLFFNSPRMVQSWITRENVNDLILSNGFSGEIDLFSLDIDGNDYWIWKTIDCIQPRVIVLEFNMCAGAERAWAMPYDPNYVADWKSAYGASLPAFVKLGREKGYRLVGTLSYGINAFFVREGLGEDVLPTRAIHELPCYNKFYAGSCSGWVDV